MNSPIRYLDSQTTEFGAALSQLLDREGSIQGGVESIVTEILNDVRDNGDSALIRLTNRFDQRSVHSFDELVVDESRLALAQERVDAKVLDAIKAAAGRIETYHQQQKQVSWQYTDAHGNQLGQLVNPLDRVGIYVPGGKASYPSSVLMTAIPAKVAGVKDITLVVPAPAGVLNESVLAAAAICGVNKIYTIGGAQAVAALAYGTESVAGVDKVVGPGNIYVATAKRMVFGLIGIDMIAGPSEVVVIADSSATPEWLVMDMFAQAEHDENAQSILISPDRRLLDEVRELITSRLPEMQRTGIIAASLRKRGALIKTQDLEEAVQVSNLIAPEHLELAVLNPEQIVDQIRNAGAIFMGHFSAESVGDYSAGPSHVLPTSGTARFSSALGVYDFQKRSSLINCSPSGASELAKIASTLAREEGLIAHALSAECRITR